MVGCEGFGAPNRPYAPPANFFHLTRPRGVIGMLLDEVCVEVIKPSHLFCVPGHAEYDGFCKPIGLPRKSERFRAIARSGFQCMRVESPCPVFGVGSPEDNGPVPLPGRHPAASAVVTMR
jgi:hypothetical protein